MCARKAVSARCSSLPANDRVSGSWHILSAGCLCAHTFQIKFQHAAWHDKPSFGIVTANDKVLLPAFLRWRYRRSNTKVREVKASHIVYMSHRQATADVTLEAATFFEVRTGQDDGIGSTGRLIRYSL